MDMDLGIMVEGVVELDPMTGRMVLRIQQDDGSNVFLDIQEQLAKQVGKEVRFILTPMTSIYELAKLVNVDDI
jgi:citrate lyase gamma subunit